MSTSARSLTIGEIQERAANILDAEADLLRRSHTDQSGEWIVYYKGQADRETHDEMLRISRLLREHARSSGLTFASFRAANVARCAKWHPAGIDSWSPSDWMTAVTGELGELASLLKMRNRERDGLPGNKFSPTTEQIADELADVLTYLDLLAHVLGVDLGRAAAEKFNKVSERVGFPDRIELEI